MSNDNWNFNLFPAPTPTPTFDHSALANAGLADQNNGVGSLVKSWFGTQMPADAQNAYNSKRTG